MRFHAQRLVIKLPEDSTSAATCNYAQTMKHHQIFGKNKKNREASCGLKERKNEIQATV